MSLSNGTASASSCTFSINVSATEIGVQTNATSVVTAFAGALVGNTVTASVSVVDLFFQ